VEITRAARTLVDRHSPSLEQAILTDFIVEGHFSRHIRRMRVLYAERQEILIAAVTKELGGLLTVPSAEAGLHLVGWLRSGINATTAAHLAADVGVRIQPLSAYGIESPAPHGVILAYAALHRSEIELGVQKLASAWNRLN
jgi:GntR family transcriptional regulator/MocR family aminotransferase